MPWTGPTFIRHNEDFSGATVWQSDAAAAFLIESVRHDFHDQDLAQGINACLNKNGANTPTANIPYGGFRNTGMSAGAATADSATFGQTITAASLDGATNILSLARTTGGDVTVDLTPIATGVNTSFFARIDTTNTFEQANTFLDNVICNNQFFLTDSGFGNGFRLKRVASTAPLTHGMEFNGLGSSVGVSFAIGMDGSSVPQAYIGGALIWNEDNLDTTGFIRDTDSVTASGAWTFTSSPIRLPAQVIQSGAGFNASTTMTNNTTWQVAMSGGTLIKFVDSTPYGTALFIGGSNIAWHSGNLRSASVLAPTGGNPNDLAVVPTGADRGLWQNLAGVWTKLIAFP